MTATQSWVQLESAWTVPFVILKCGHSRVIMLCFNSKLHRLYVYIYIHIHTYVYIYIYLYMITCLYDLILSWMKHKHRYCSTNSENKWRHNWMMMISYGKTRRPICFTCQPCFISRYLHCCNGHNGTNNSTHRYKGSISDSLMAIVWFDGLMVSFWGNTPESSIVC